MYARTCWMSCQRAQGESGANLEFCVAKVLLLLAVHARRAMPRLTEQQTPETETVAMAGLERAAAAGCGEAACELHRVAAKTSVCLRAPRTINTTVAVSARCRTEGRACAEAAACAAWQQLDGRAGAAALLYLPGTDGARR